MKKYFLQPTKIKKYKKLYNKIWGKEVRKNKNQEKNTYTNIKDVTWKVQMNDDERKDRWREYFNDLCNVDK